LEVGSRQKEPEEGASRGRLASQVGSTQPEVRVRDHSEVKMGVNPKISLVFRHQNERLCQAVARVRPLMPELGVGL
jgi:hypothetical protein